jgi:hypothetical protein
VKKLSTWRVWLLTRFSKPVSDRAVYRYVAAQAPRSILEIGLSSMERTCNLLQFAQRSAKTREIRYCGIDLFDARAASPTIRLKDAHCQLRKLVGAVRLIPGDLSAIHPGLANQIGNHDLVIATLSGNLEDCRPAATLLPRLIAENGRLLLREGGEAGKDYRILTRPEAEGLVSKQEQGKRAA